MLPETFHHHAGDMAIHDIATRGPGAPGRIGGV
jgi:hypothetical protein